MGFLDSILGHKKGSRNKIIVKKIMHRIMQLRSMGKTDAEIMSILRSEKVNPAIITAALKQLNTMQKPVELNAKSEVDQNLNVNQNVPQVSQNNEDPSKLIEKLLQQNQEIKPNIPIEIPEKPEIKQVQQNVQNIQPKQVIQQQNIQPVQTMPTNAVQVPQGNMNLLAVTPQVQQQMPESKVEIVEEAEDVEALIERLVNEKTKGMDSRLGDLEAELGRIRAEMQEIKRVLKELRDKYASLQEESLNKIEEYAEALENIGAQIKALQRILQHVIPALAENITKLQEVVDILSKKFGQ